MKGAAAVFSRVRSKRHIALFTAVVLLVVACGRSGPNLGGGAVLPFATTGGGPGASPAATDATDARVRSVEQAALSYARTVLHARNPQPTMMDTGSSGASHQDGPIWVVQLMGDRFELQPCGDNSTPASYVHNCGTGNAVRISVRLSDLAVIDVELYDVPATPTAQLAISLPPDAVLQTREQAIAAALLGETGDADQAPHVASADLILAGQEDALHGFAPDAPFWRVTLDHSQFGYSCPPTVAQRTNCVASSLTRYFDAITGELRVEGYGDP